MEPGICNCKIFENDVIILQNRIYFSLNDLVKQAHNFNQHTLSWRKVHLSGSVHVICINTVVHRYGNQSMTAKVDLLYFEENRVISIHIAKCTWHYLKLIYLFLIIMNHSCVVYECVKHSSNTLLTCSFLRADFHLHQMKACKWMCRRFPLIGLILNKHCNLDFIGLHLFINYCLLNLAWNSYPWHAIFTYPGYVFAAVSLWARYCNFKSRPTAWIWM